MIIEIDEKELLDKIEKSLNNKLAIEAEDYIRAVYRKTEIQSMIREKYLEVISDIIDNAFKNEYTEIDKIVREELRSEIRKKITKAHKELEAL